MKKIILLCVFCVSVAISFGQKETFDLVTYTPPPGGGWKKEATENIMSYTIVNKKNNSWCRIGIIKSTASKGSIKQDFESEWQELVVKNYKPTEAPQLTEVQEAEGWKIKAGAGNFNFNNAVAIAMLTTMTGYDRCVSIVATTNSQDYIKDIEALLSSVDLKKPEMVSTQTPVTNDDKNSIIGTWGKTGSVNPSYNDAYATSIAGYSTDQYTFHSNGTYMFFSKTFGMSFPKILLVKENGIYQISGNNITITPQKSVIEAWSKKDGVDKWGKLLTTQNRTLEKITYQFTKHYFSGIQIWNLVLQNNKATQRDGPFSSNTTFSNAWYYSPISANNTAIELPGGQQIKTEEIPTGSGGKKEPVQLPATNSNEAVIGTWGISVVVQYPKPGAGSNIRQYVFNANGTYSFYIKTFRYSYDKLLLTKETGTYQISGNKIIISPQKSIIESWSKKDGTDNWGKLLSTQNKTVEKTTYQFTKHYSAGMQEWNLVLQANKETQRDGPFNGGSAFSNAWIYSLPCSKCLIELPN